MHHRTRLWLMIIVIIGLVSTMIVIPAAFTIPLNVIGAKDVVVTTRLGLDLSGGSQVLLEAVDCASEGIEQRLQNVQQIIENRINGLGVTEPVIQIQGNCRILVELPAIDDPAQAIGLIQQTGKLEWVDTGDQSFLQGAIIRTAGSPEPIVKSSTSPTETSVLTGTVPTIPDTIFPVIVSGSELDPAKLGAGLGGQLGNEPQVQFALMGEAVQRFAQHTAANTGRYLCIVLDNVVQSCPVINSAIPDGQGVITVGSGGIEEATDLVNLLRYGALPVSLQVVQSNTIGPTLGEDSIRASIIAGIIGLAAVALFMLLYYRIAGLVAVVTLLLYGLITFAIYKLIPVTLTLPGIAGFILSVAVAVDANTLIIERLKEELRNGRHLSVAVEVAFERAWSSIRDSNLATLITCVILFWFGSNFGASIVKGFAATLFIGVLISLLASVQVTRTFLRFVASRNSLEGRSKLFGA